MSAARVLAVGAIAIGLAALLNAETLREMAERQPFDSPTRGVALALTEPLERVSQLLSLDRPGEAFDDWRNRDQGGTGEFVLPTTSAPATTVATGAVTALPPVTGPAAVGDTTTTGPTTTVAPKPDGEIRVYIGGDSMAQGFGEALSRTTGEAGVEPTLDYKVSSGLTRPDFFDWPRHLQEKMASVQPDIVVVTFGGNDAQPIDVGDRNVPVDDPAWAEEYGRRVGAVMDYLSSEGRKLVWVGTPNAEGEGFNQRLSIIRSVVQQQAATRPQVTFVDPWPMFLSPSGGYADYIVDDDGEAKLMRANDGFHLNRVGAEYLARKVAAEVLAEANRRRAAG